jgi:hypothetical protein
MAPLSKALLVMLLASPQATGTDPSHGHEACRVHLPR